MAYWTIKNDPLPNNAGGDDLDGLQIQTFSGDLLTGYQLIDPSVAKVLATTEQKAPPIQFEHVNYKGGTWHLNVASPPQRGATAYGVWRRDKSVSQTGGQDGDFTAQAGSGLGEEPCEAADSAKA